VKELLPRLLAAWMAANASLVFARVAIGFANAVSRAFVAEGVGFEGVGSVLKLTVATAVPGAPLLTVLVALVAVVLAVGLVCTAVMRACTVLVLVAAAPLFLMGYALPQTEGAANLWWRSLFACLGVQVGQAVVVTAAVRVYFAAPEGNLLALPHSVLMDLLVVLCLLWLALRIPSYATRLVFQSRRNPASAVRYHVVGRGMRAATKAAGKAAKTALAAAA
jgi:TrbL/VirB6 plasmid conjugal transfer protein